MFVYFRFLLTTSDHEGSWIRLHVVSSEPDRQLICRGLRPNRKHVHSF